MPKKRIHSPVLRPSQFLVTPADQANSRWLGALFITTISFCGMVFGLIDARSVVMIGGGLLTFNFSLDRMDTNSGSPYI